MFDTTTIGKKIARLRKENNLTQMQLADALEVSYQAVSNWERGNSMPDISKLPDLANLFNTSIDSILDDDKPTKLVNSIINNTEKEFIKNEKIELNTVASIAPILPTSKCDEICDDVINNDEDFNFRELISLAPFLSEETLGILVDKIDMKIDIESLVQLLPFLEEDKVDQLAFKCCNITPNHLVKIAPFVSNEAFSSIVKGMDIDTDFNTIISIVPFLEEDTISSLINRCTDSLNINHLISLAPFASVEDLDNLVDKLSKTSLKQLVPLAPFISTNKLNEIVSRHIKSGDYSGLKELAGFLD